MKIGRSTTMISPRDLLFRLMPDVTTHRCDYQLSEITNTFVQLEKFN